MNYADIPHAKMVTSEVDPTYRHKFCMYSMRICSPTASEASKAFNYKGLWTAERKAELMQAFRKGMTLAAIASYTGRTKLSIVCALEKLGMIAPDTQRKYYWSTVQVGVGQAPEKQDLQTEIVTQEKEAKTALNQNTTGTIEHRIYVDNVDIKDLSFTSMIGKISKLRSEIKTLEALELPSSKAIGAQLAKRQKALDELVALLDSHFTEDGPAEATNGAATLPATDK